MVANASLCFSVAENTPIDKTPTPSITLHWALSICYSFPWDLTNKALRGIWQRSIGFPLPRQCPSRERNARIRRQSDHTRNPRLPLVVDCVSPYPRCAGSDRVGGI